MSLTITAAEANLLAATDLFELRGYAATARIFGAEVADEALAIVEGPSAELAE